MATSIDLARIRHELRTPINHILGYCEILLDEEDMPELIVADLRKIHRGGRELLELISRYFDDATFQTARDWPQVQHELRTPVNQIIGYSELLSELAAELGQRRLISDLTKIRNAAQQWLMLMEGYLLAGDSATGQTGAEPPPAEPGGNRPSPPCAPDDLLPATLLVVDDDQPSRELLARRLHRAGFQVATAAGAKEALDLVESRAFDLLLVDCVMPELDGLELLRRIRARKSATELPVVMVTGRDSSGDVVQALRLGANDYLTKPVDFEVALARLGTHLHWRRARAELNQRMDEMRKMADDLQVRNEFIKRVFGRYVTDAVVKSVLEDPTGLQLGGQRRSVSVLMSDLRGFTRMAEQLAPEKVVELLNTYLGAMADVIVQYHGVVDEFIGDAVLALFGAPIPRPDHAESAVACALAMQAAMERVNRRLGRLAIRPLEMGIGVNTGEVVVGNIGSDKRAKYGVVGAQVNLTARIQALTVGGEVLVSAATASELKPGFKSDHAFTICAKGFTAPVKLFSVTGLHGQDHLDLPQTDFQTDPPGQPGPVKVYRLTDGRIAATTGAEGQLTLLSSRSGYLKTSEPLHARCDLRLVRPSSTQAPGTDFDCKVMEDQPAELGWLVRFSSPVPG